MKTDWRGGGMTMRQFYVLGYEDNRYNHNFTVRTEKTDALEHPHLPHMVEGLAHSRTDCPFLPAVLMVFRRSSQCCRRRHFCRCRLDRLV
ncbi:hypothetical protein ESCNG_130015 [Neisseria gonorrhoeae]|uniref:Uncharacterized protein n=1 Tax=Neisseria gonorrhoeae TaxID=485 RepID=A0AB74EMY4_NEIGO|nr:hypothetical protein ESCNG_120045 [Neisseria gonorrhoeae]SCW09357.1 hypothetical protein ESCNG_100050 [Neisseria gonorrhoeae]SCW09446.1 hypothetical protein ESCNG_110050 [Neisseria gonorrhoeae]SCW09639.1 hypothetical protein ESCNG_130015 [Neisseria gonorrhoeae]SCW11051.1 hypothetical protein ESCNG_150018 [Neisseria gonorrhoeae]